MFSALRFMSPLSVPARLPQVKVPANDCWRTGSGLSLPPFLLSIHTRPAVICLAFRHTHWACFCLRPLHLPRLPLSVLFSPDSHGFLLHCIQVSEILSWLGLKKCPPPTTLYPFTLLYFLLQYLFTQNCIIDLFAYLVSDPLLESKFPEVGISLA